jgi:tripartite-type tricarboxylate transporter receptor subunit TctC
MNRRELLQGLAALGSSSAFLPAMAQDSYPARPIRVICGSGPGALADVATRLYAEPMARHLGQPLVVDNIAGASSLIAARAAAKADPDGYTLLTAANTIVTIPHLQAKAGYAMRDFTPIGEMARSPSVMVTSSESQLKSLADLVIEAKKTPGGLNYASGGQGTTSHLPAELFLHQAGVKINHVPYKGVAAGVPDLVANRVAFMLATPTSVAGLVKSGQLRVLAITSEDRSPKYPDVPTFKELGYSGATFEIWIGVLAPARLPEVIRAKLGRAMEAARDDPRVAQRLEDLGESISGVRTPEEFESSLRTEEAKYAKLIKGALIVAE